MQGSIVVLGGDLIKNVLRLGSNLIMTRLLYPEAFGLMLIITFVQTGLVLLSDTGVKDAIIIKSRGREREFVNTAWVITIYRGLLLALITILLAWPLAQFYDQPDLFGLMLISALAPVVQGFASPNRFLYFRDLKLSQLVLVEILGQIIGLSVGITLLYFFPNIWVLGAISVFSGLVLAVLSFVFFKGPTPQFKLDKAVGKEMFNFGKWIFFASALTFLAMEADKIIFSKMVTAEQLGVFSVAIALAKVVETISQSLSGKLLVPLYAAMDQPGMTDFGKKVGKVKLGMCAMFLPPILFLTLFGSWLVSFLYDERYHGAGWMLQVISLGGIFSVYHYALSSVVTGKGDVKAHLFLHVFKVVLYFAVLITAGQLFGVVGMVYAMAIVPFFVYFAFGIYVLRYGIYALKMDLIIFAMILAPILAIWTAVGWPKPT